MKIKTKEQYDARFRRGAPKKQSVSGPGSADVTTGLSPNHAARYADILTAHQIRPHKHYGEHVKMPLMGQFQGCPHSLSYWREDEPDKYGKPVYFAVAMPCVVQHGYDVKMFNNRQTLIPSIGKAGEHQDKLGRVW